MVKTLHVVSRDAQGRDISGTSDGIYSFATLEKKKKKKAVTIKSF